MNAVLTILGLIKGDSGYYYDLKMSYDRYFSAAYPLAHSQLYSTLASMTMDGLIQSIGEDAVGQPDNEKYELTTKGQDRLEEWMLTPEAPTENGQSEVYSKIVIAFLIDRGANASVLDIQRRGKLDRMRQATTQKLGADMTDMLFYDYAIHHIEADLRWIDLTSARPEEPKKDMRQ